MANRQHLTVFAGENRTPTLYARDSDNAAVNLTGSTITWNVGRSPRNLDSDWPLVTKTGSIVSASGGSFSVAIEPSDTLYLQGDYEHMALITDADGNVTIGTEGKFRVHRTIE